MWTLEDSRKACQAAGFRWRLPPSSSPSSSPESFDHYTSSFSNCNGYGLDWNHLNPVGLGSTSRFLGPSSVIPVTAAGVVSFRPFLRAHPMVMLLLMLISETCDALADLKRCCLCCPFPTLLSHLAKQTFLARLGCILQCPWYSCTAKLCRKLRL